MRVIDVRTGEGREVEGGVLRELWWSGFPEDKGQDLEAFWSLYLSDARWYGLWEEGQLVSMSLCRPQLFCGEGGKGFYRGGFIVGVVTHPSWRGRGLSSEILKFIACHQRQEGVQLLRLSTYIPTFYERLGYLAFGRHYKILLEPELAASVSSPYRTYWLAREERDLLPPFYKEHCGWGSTWRDEGEWERRWRSGGRTLVISREDPQGSPKIRAYLWQEEETLWNEVVASDLESLQAAANFLGKAAAAILVQPQLAQALSKAGRAWQCDSWQMVLPLDDTIRVQEGWGWEDW